MFMFKNRTSGNQRLQNRIEAIGYKLDELRQMLDSDVASIDIMRMAASLDAMHAAIDAAKESVTLKLPTIYEDTEEVEVDGGVFTMELPKANK